MTQIPLGPYILFGLLAVVAGSLGVDHAPSGLPRIFWAAVTLLGAASLIHAGYTSRVNRRRARETASSHTNRANT